MTAAELAVETETGHQQFVSFRIGEEKFAFAMDKVLEIIRLPETIDVPLTPGALVGLANLRGSVLPILDLRRILDIPAAEYNEATRVIVTDVGASVGMIVDRVLRVASVEAEQIDRKLSLQSEYFDSEKCTDLLAGVIKSEDTMVQILNLECLVEKEFTAVPPAANEKLALEQSSRAMARHSQAHEEDDDTVQLVSFTLQDQEFAFHLLDIVEIVRIPEKISRVPRVDQAFLGLINLRGQLLPLVNLSMLFMMEQLFFEDQGRILVVNLSLPGGNVRAMGLVVDDVKEVLRIEKYDQDSIPPLLTSDDDNYELERICRLDNGRRLVSVLQTQSLLAHPVIQVALEAVQNEEEETKMTNDWSQWEADDDTVQLVVFHLGEQEFGVSIDDVQEITRLPEKLEKVPKTADFIEGMVNLRGTVLPVLDMRTRFDMPKLKSNDRQRIIVLSLDGKHTGFIVDCVDEVIRLSADDIEDAPDLSQEQAQMMGKVVNLKEQKRMIQILDVRELLTDDEHLSLNHKQEEEQ